MSIPRYRWLGRLGARLHVLLWRCAWCGLLLGLKRSYEAPGGWSDGICRACSAAYFRPSAR